jgi:formate hydrogenlyase subunit 6/NADH:ubiquinone oxidoreductase subunit I
VKACPVKALTLEDATRPPLLEAKLCISCCCCHEVCPADAIRMTQSLILRVLKVFKGFE